MLTKIIFLVSAGSIAFGQETGNDRFATMESCKAAIMAGSFTNYIPSFLTNHREPRDGEEIRPLEERGCVNLHIVGGRGSVPQAKGERYIFRGSQIVARYDCGNDASEIEYVPQELPQVVESVVQQVVDVQLPPELPPVFLISMPPDLGPPPDRDYVATLVWDKKKGWYWTWTPLWCVDVRRPRDLWHPATCAALAVGGYWLAGGFVKAFLWTKVPGMDGGPGFIFTLP